MDVEEFKGHIDRVCCFVPDEKHGVDFDALQFTTQ